MLVFESGYYKFPTNRSRGDEVRGFLFSDTRGFLSSRTRASTIRHIVAYSSATLKTIQGLISLTNQRICL